MSTVWAPDILVRLGNPGDRYADKTKVGGDEGGEDDSTGAEVLEEPIDRRFEVGVGWIVLVPDRQLLQDPPESFDQIEVGGVWRKMDQPDRAPLTSEPLPDRRRTIVARVVQHEVDRARRRVARHQRLEQADHRRAGNLLRLLMHDVAFGPARRAVDIDVDPAARRLNTQLSVAGQDCLAGETVTLVRRRPGPLRARRVAEMMV